MKIVATNLMIGESVIIDTDEWDETTGVKKHTDNNHVVVMHNNWEYLVKYEDFEAYVVTRLTMMRAIDC